MIGRRAVLTFGPSLIAGSVAALCLPFAGWTDHMVDLTPINLPIFLASIGWLYFCFRKPRPFLFWHAYLWAFGYFFFGLMWIGNALLIDSNPFAWAWPLAVVGLPFLLSFFLGVAFLGADRLVHRPSVPPAYTPVLFAAIFTVAEIARGHLFTGFPWNLPGMSWSTTLPVFQILSVIGIYGLTFITLWLAAHITERFIFKTRARWMDAALVVLSSSVLYFGIWQLDTPPAAASSSSGLQVVMVQANIPQSERFDPDRMPDHFYRHLAYSEHPANLSDTPTLIIWPETILPPAYLASPVVQREIRHLLSTYPVGSHLLSGALYVDQDQQGKDHYYNGLVAFDGASPPRALYAKQHLVPFGEYVPYQKYIPIAPVARFENLTPRQDNPVVRLSGLPPFRPLICYESVFGTEVRSSIGDADWMLVITNDAWYGNSPGPHQHWAESRARAIEMGRAVVRVAVTGVSSTFDAQGRAVETMDYGTGGARVVSVPLVSNPPHKTIYAQWGDAPLGVVLLVIFAGVGVLSVRHRGKRKSPLARG